mmetsp:Transcript_1211/g.2551  ORF Transcript_1211/g.2551 Transcript_1211/m.2551 type:complete len:111 (-) Transcript_1211:134-466(-)
MATLEAFPREPLGEWRTTKRLSIPMTAKPNDRKALRFLEESVKNSGINQASYLAMMFWRGFEQMEAIWSSSPHWQRCQLRHYRTTDYPRSVSIWSLLLLFPTNHEFFQTK